VGTGRPGWSALSASALLPFDDDPRSSVRAHLIEAKHVVERVLGGVEADLLCKLGHDLWWVTVDTAHGVWGEVWKGTSTSSGSRPRRARCMRRVPSCCCMYDCGAPRPCDRVRMRPLYMHAAACAVFFVRIPEQQQREAGGACIPTRCITLHGASPRGCSPREATASSSCLGRRARRSARSPDQFFCRGWSPLSKERVA